MPEPKNIEDVTTNTIIPDSNVPELGQDDENVSTSINDMTDTDSDDHKDIDSDDTGNNRLDDSGKDDQSKDNNINKPPSSSLDPRRLQADRDRAEQRLKDVYKQVLPYVEVDQAGNIIGQKKENIANREQLYEEAAMTGSPEALKQLMEMTKEEAKRETFGYVQENMTREREVESLKKDYPSLYQNDGSPNYNDPLYQATENVIRERPYLASADVIRTAIEVAEARLLKDGLSSRDQQIRNAAQMRLKQSGSATIGSGHSTSSQQVDNIATHLSSEQIIQAKKEGYDNEGLRRLAKIVKRAKKEGGYVLS